MIELAGKYEDASARGYVVMQDDAQRSERRAFIAFVRVMRQKDETVRSGTIYITDETFIDAGSDDESRSGAVARALVWWLANHPTAQFFQLQARISENGGMKGVELIDEIEQV
jgi:hypothetical protein